MRLTLLRIASLSTHTVGAFFVNGKFKCLILEDIKRVEKVYGATRIPAGLYPVVLRSVGSVHSWLKKKVPDHAGSLWVQNVPGFEFILIHPGNTSLDTLGCLLPGMGYSVGKDFISNSFDAYLSFYSEVKDAILADISVTIHVVDELII